MTGEIQDTESEPEDDIGAESSAPVLQLWKLILAALAGIAWWIEAAVSRVPPAAAAGQGVGVAVAMLGFLWFATRVSRRAGLTIPLSGRTYAGICLISAFLSMFAALFGVQVLVFLFFYVVLLTAAITTRRVVDFLLTPVEQ